MNNNNHNTSKFSWAKEAAVNITRKMAPCRLLKKMEVDGWVPALPRSKVDSTLPMYFAFHVVGMCNVRCKKAHDHVPYGTGLTQYVALEKWARTCYLTKVDLKTAVPISTVR